jgi:hypothetical protein
VIPLTGAEGDRLYFCWQSLSAREGAMIAQQLLYGLRSDQKAFSKALEPGASVTRTDIAVAWMGALAAFCFLALLFWHI